LVAFAAIATGSLERAIAGHTGNGAPRGAHYTLNVIGVPQEKVNGFDFDGVNAHDNGRRIFVKLQGNTKIQLIESDDFQVLDPNGTDGEASFALPVADTDVQTCTVIGQNADGSDILLCGSGTTYYSVFIRALAGQGSAKLALCGVDEFGNEYCNTGDLELNLSAKRPPKFENVSAELLYLYDVDLDGDGDVDLKRVPLFSDKLEGYFWNYDNDGLRLVQMRFYQCGTTVDADGNIISSECDALLTGNGN
jgi:hypothetical protein